MIIFDHFFPFIIEFFALVEPMKEHLEHIGVSDQLLGSVLDYLFYLFHLIFELPENTALYGDLIIQVANDPLFRFDNLIEFSANILFLVNLGI